MSQRYYAGYVTFEYVSLIPIRKFRTADLVLELDFGSMLGTEIPTITERRIGHKEAAQFAMDNGATGFFGNRPAPKKRKTK